MRRAAIEIHEALRAGGGVLARSAFPELVGAIDWEVRRGRLAVVLPGVYAATEERDTFTVRVQALAAWNRDAVLVGRAAARLSFWSDLGAPVIEAAAGHDLTPPGFAVKRRRIPPELVVEAHGLRVTSPALTTLDLCSTLGGNAIDTVLRTRAATLDQLHEALALTSARPGNRARRVLLEDSRDEPWSEAERGLHRILREAGITGWKSNARFDKVTGCYRIDVAFRKLRLAIEVDGWEFHNTREAFENDRWRQNDLVLAGWRVLRFTAKMIEDHPLIVLRTIEDALCC